MRRFSGLFALALLAGCTPKEVPDEDLTYKAVQDVTLTASDGVKVFGTRYRPEQKGKVIVLMFHQAGSNSDEYKDIAPKLVRRGLECLAIDQRSGGTMWGRENKTLKESGRSEWSYMDAYKDIMAAYDWAKKREFTKIVVWGSSYSASLVLKLASENEVAAVVAFSPGEYFDDKTLVGGWNAKVKTACYFGFPKKEAMDSGYVLYQTAPKAIERMNDTLVAIEGGAHGSSTLLSEKAPKAYGSYWTSLWTFFEVNRITKPEQSKT